ARSAARRPLPIVREAGTSGTGSTVISACLMVSLAISGRPRAGATALARGVFPLPGGPDTTTYQPGGHPSVTRPLSCRARPLLPSSGQQHHHHPSRDDGLPRGAAGGPSAAYSFVRFIGGGLAPYVAGRRVDSRSFRHNDAPCPALHPCDRGRPP